MLVNCKRGCKLKDGMTTASIDVESNEAVCDYCAETIENISIFAKNSMKSRGEIVKKNNKKPFMYKCTTCKEIKDVSLNSKDEIIGTDCKKFDCKFEVNKFIVGALKAANRIIKDEPNETDNIT